MLLQRGGELERNQAQIIALRQPYAPLLVCHTMQMRGTCCRSTKSTDSHLRLPNYSQQNSVSACLTLHPGERARRFPRREARTRFTVDWEQKP